MAKISELRDEIAGTQALIDQARAHLERHKHLYSEEQFQALLAEIDYRQLKLDAAKIIINREFPKGE